MQRKVVYIMRIGYIRVSTVDQNEDRQKMLLDPFNIDLYFSEKVSGKNVEDRTELQTLLKLVTRKKAENETDIVYVTELARLARSAADLYKIADIFGKNNVQLVSVKERIDTTTSTGKLLFGLLAVLAEFERDLIHERQAEGIAAAKAQGKSLGRPKVSYSEEKFDELYSLYQQRLVTAVSMAKQLSISPATLYRILAKRKEENIKNIT